MSDLTSGVRTTIKNLEKMLVDDFKPKFLKKVDLCLQLHSNNFE